MLNLIVPNNLKVGILVLNSELIEKPNPLVDQLGETLNTLEVLSVVLNVQKGV